MANKKPNPFAAKDKELKEAKLANKKLPKGKRVGNGMKSR